MAPYFVEDGPMFAETASLCYCSLKVINDPQVFLWFNLNCLLITVVTTKPYVLQIWGKPCRVKGEIDL